MEWDAHPEKRMKNRRMERIKRPSPSQYLRQCTQYTHAHGRAQKLFGHFWYSMAGILPMSTILHHLLLTQPHFTLFIFSIFLFSLSVCLLIFPVYNSSVNVADVSATEAEWKTKPSIPLVSFCIISLLYLRSSGSSKKKMNTTKYIYFVPIQCVL